MKYFELSCNSELYIKPKYLGQYIDLDSNFNGNFNLVQRGKKIEEWTDIEFFFDPIKGYKFLDFISNIFTWPIVSERFQKVLNTLDPHSIQYLPISIRNTRTNEIRNDYYAMNVYKVVYDVFDVSKSHYPFDWQYQNLDDVTIKVPIMYALKTSLIGSYDIFKIEYKRDISLSLFVSENVKKLVKKHKITGCRFDDVILV